jgi:hypothetical protein
MLEKTECGREQIRMINLAEVRGMPVTFIRYNPDGYEPVSGQKSIKIEQREKKLGEWIIYAMDHPP